jgi:hypothetical protein
MDPGGAKEQGKGCGGRGAEEVAEEDRGGVGGETAMEARCGAGRMEQERRCVCDVSVGDIVVSREGKVLCTSGKAGFTSPNCNVCLRSFWPNGSIKLTWISRIIELDKTTSDKTKNG